jgi:hypothetical protein
MIISGNEDAQFEMNSGNGQISLVGILDRESQDSYVLQVMATDSGSTTICALIPRSVSVATN